MLKIIFCALVFLFAAGLASAQQAPQDACTRVTATYKQLLGEANDRVASLAADASTLEVKVKALQAEIEAFKGEKK